VMRDNEKWMVDNSRFHMESLFLGNEDSSSERIRKRIVQRLNREIRANATSGAYNFLRTIGHFPRVLKNQLGKYQIIHAHKVDLWNALFLAGVSPVIAHFHTADGLTGGCVLNGDCENLEQGCYHCPVVKGWARKLPPINLNRRKRWMLNSGVHIVVNSQWTRKVAERSPVLAENIETTVIYPPFNEAVFCHENTQKNLYKNGSDAKVIGFVSYSLGDKNKGFSDYLEVLKELRKTCHVMGVAIGGYDPNVLGEIPDYVEVIDPIQDSRILAEYYRSMDLLLVPSRSESFGRISIEAQACGTPVVCYAVGGLPETVLEGHGGYVVPFGDKRAMIQASQRILMHQSGLCDGRDGQHQKFINQFSMNSVGNKQLALYDKIITER
jgi:glycosyltransferase involved in cell wall biosynthesis